MSNERFKRKKSVFISYRRQNENVKNFVFHLKNYMKNENVVVRYDEDLSENGQMNQDTLIAVCRQEARERENLVLVVTKNSLQELIDWKEHEKDESIHYVFEELRSAIQNHNCIVPVFFEDPCDTPLLDNDKLQRLFWQLFHDCLHLSDSYLFIRRGAEESEKAFFKRIVEALGYREEDCRSMHVDMSEIYWVGTRQSDMPKIEDGCGFRSGVFFFGIKDTHSAVMCDESVSDRVDHNDSSDKSQDQFIEDRVVELIERDKKEGRTARFMFYNPSTVYRLNLDSKCGAEHFECMNDEELLEKVNNKDSFRDLVNGTPGDPVIPMLPILKRRRADCDYEDLLRAFKNGEFTDSNRYYNSENKTIEVPPIQYDEKIRFIVQAPIASGGSGTFILSEENAAYIYSMLGSKHEYLISVYHTNNIPVNVHAVIYDDGVLFSPPSIQIEREVSMESKLLYKGADFVAYRSIEQSLRSQFRAQAERLAVLLQRNGYRGVCGIDAIMHNGRVNILEVNGRFQASTELINRVLLPRHKSIQELNLEAFSGQSCPNAQLTLHENLTVPFSNYSYSYEGQTGHDAWICKQARASRNSSLVSALQTDGYDAEKTVKYRPQAYLFRVDFNRNIVSVNEDGGLFINENISGLDKKFQDKILNREKLAVKLALMIQGIHVEESVQGKLREATNNAVDLKIGSGSGMMVVNAPTNIPFVGFSPFELKQSETNPEKYRIDYYGSLLLDNVEVFLSDANQTREIRGDDGRFRHSYAEIAYLSTDRLRVHLTNACCFKTECSDSCPDGMGCKFCNIQVNHNQVCIAREDIQKVVNVYMQDRKIALQRGDEIVLRHFLIGGQSMRNSDENLIAAAEILSQYRLPIYVMSLPLKDEIVRKLVNLGVWEYAYNIEVFNERCRRKYMPGKGMIPVSKYLEALEHTRRILAGTRAPRERKNVRSMVIVGLEPMRDMKNGIKALIDGGIEPLLSVFRPLPDTALETLNAPPVKLVYDLFWEVSNWLHDASPAEEAADNRFRKLGPECVCCQNNTVSLPWDIQVERKLRARACIADGMEIFEEAAK